MTRSDGKGDFAGDEWDLGQRVPEVTVSDRPVSETARVRRLFEVVDADVISSGKWTVSWMLPSRLQLAGKQSRNWSLVRGCEVWCGVARVVTVAINVKHERGSWVGSCGVARGATKVSRQQGPRKIIPRTDGEVGRPRKVLRNDGRSCSVTSWCD